MSESLEEFPRSFEYPEKEVERLVKEKSDWLDRIMKFYLPSELYQAGQERRRPKAIMRYLEKNKFHMREIPSKSLTQFCQGDEVLAEFQIEYRG